MSGTGGTDNLNLTERQRGIILLTEGRSGSSWLGQLTNSTGVMGTSSEWLDAKLLGVKPGTTNADGFLRAVIAAARSENGRFAVKIFPRHLLQFRDWYGVDFIPLCKAQHDVQFVRLSRQDRLRQAISLVRARQSGQWSSLATKRDARASFDFFEIARAIHFLERSEAFWNAYIVTSPLRPAHFYYDDLLSDPSPYLQWAANTLGVEAKASGEVGYSIQRNEETEDWVERFLAIAEVQGFDALGAVAKHRSRVKKILSLLGKKGNLWRDLHAF